MCFVRFGLQFPIEVYLSLFEHNNSFAWYFDIFVKSYKMTQRELYIFTIFNELVGQAHDFT